MSPHHFLFVVAWIPETPVSALGAVQAVRPLQGMLAHMLICIQVYEAAYLCACAYTHTFIMFSIVHTCERALYTYI